MNARTQVRTFTAQELADMPFANEVRRAVAAQECNHMNEHHAKRLVKEVNEKLGLDFTVHAMVCTGIDGRRFIWEAQEACGLCGGDGYILGHDSKAHDCWECEDINVETVTTDYDGNLIEAEA